MVARRKKKYERGEASNYMSRKHALAKLQLNLKDFRRLCILKGIHPREPRSRKRAQKGDLTKIQTLYHEKDIRFLLHEPIVHKFRDFKVFLKKLKKATAKGNYDTADRLKSNKPKYTLDHIVRERYPTFVDAIRDLEDCLCLCFLYSTFPKNPKTPIEMITLCRRLCVEFMHYIIESKSLRKVFVSIKGYYYQAEIMGQIVTWVVPHPSFTYESPVNVDLRLMSIFVEFYTTVLGFVNYRLYHKLNLKYPPVIGIAGTKTLVPQSVVEEGTEKGPEDENIVETANEMVCALNQSLAKTVVSTDDDNVELDNIPDELTEGNGEGNELQKQAMERRKEMEEMKALGSLFKGIKVFLNREVPREPLVFMLRAFGGQVSWDPSLCPGSTFGEDDGTVTHQICDRPRNSMNTTHIGRDYVQPQWIFDSINQKKLLPVHKYFLGEVLPPHLSPFIKEERRIGEYMPPEEKKLLGLEPDIEEKEGSPEYEEEEEMEDSGSDKEEEEMEGSGSEKEGSEDEEEDDEEVGEEEDADISSMVVKEGKAEKKMSKADEEKQLNDEQYRLRVMMIKKKHRGLYKSMMKARKKRINESKQMERKREALDFAAKQSKNKKPKNKAK